MKDDSALTLRVALHRLLEENARIFSDREITAKVQEFLRCHDAAHVVFGCDISIVGEGTLKIFTIFGTTLGFWSHLVAYSEANAFALFRLVVNIPRAYVRAKRMSRPWPWAEHGEYLDKTIEEIRREFNINVIRCA